MLSIRDENATSPTLLFNVRNWRNTPAWHEFFLRYDTLLEQWFQGRSLDAAAADEIRSNIWMELAGRMRSFCYDPQQSFRGWLRILWRCRTIDYVRKRQLESRRVHSVEDSVILRLFDESDSPGSDFEETRSGDPVHELWMREAEEVQAAAQKRVKPRTWEVFWQIAINSRPIGEVAAEYSMTYAAAFRAYSRAGEILREEGDRRRGRFLET